MLYLWASYKPCATNPKGELVDVVFREGIRPEFGIDVPQWSEQGPPAFWLASVWPWLSTSSVNAISAASVDHDRWHAPEMKILKTSDVASLNDL